MVISAHLILLILALVCFILSALNATKPTVNYFSAGWAFVIAALIFA